LRFIGLKAVIFDIDGTLIDSVDLHPRSWMATFTQGNAAGYGVTSGKAQTALSLDLCLPER